MYTKTANRKYSDDQIRMVAEFLTNDDKREIREELNCHRNHVYRVLKGDYYDDSVMDMALKVIERRAERKAAMEGKLIEAFEALETLDLIAKL